MGALASKNFLWKEFQCRCGCGCKNINARALTKLQALRDLTGPLVINCAARCPLHNARVGGAPLSMHRATDLIECTAFDISIVGRDKAPLIAAAIDVGFGGIGANYSSFVHLDDRGSVARW